MAGTLYLVPTPIGNLGDISRRQAEILEQVDFIAAEDTRVTMKLLNHLGLRKPLMSYYRHNTDEAGRQVLSRTWWPCAPKTGWGWSPSPAPAPSSPPCPSPACPRAASPSRAFCP